ncbi:MAG: hypothetical protein ACE5RN_08590 [Nitrosopumilaceae archaeon]
MKKRREKPKLTNLVPTEKSKTSSKEFVEIEIKKNLIIKTQNPDRARLEKWKIGRKNYP